MVSVIFIMLIIMGCMWAFGRWMYPRPPKGYLQPQSGDNVTPRTCDFCGHSLAQYRGIVEGERFFCNGEHQVDFHQGKQYMAYQEKL